MNRFLATLLFLACASVTFAPTAQAQLGIAAGVNFNQLNQVDLQNTTATFENVQGYHVEVWFDLPLGPIALRPGIRYMDAGMLYEGAQEDIGSVRDDFSIQLLEVPLDLRIRLGLPLLKPYVTAGPVVRFPYELDEEIEDNFESYSVAGSIGFGLELNLGGLTLFPEVKYGFGISDFTEGFEIAGRNFNAEDGQQLNSILIRLGIGF